jgi:hypothetical protein
MLADGRLKYHNWANLCPNMRRNRKEAVDPSIAGFAPTAAVRLWGILRPEWGAIRHCLCGDQKHQVLGSPHDRRGAARPLINGTLGSLVGLTPTFFRLPGRAEMIIMIIITIIIMVLEMLTALPVGRHKSPTTRRLHPLGSDV